MADRTIRVQMSADIIVSQCISCGVTYGVTADFDQDRRKDKRNFYCPNGHSMSYTESEADILRRERDRLKQEAARLEEMQSNAYRLLEAEAQARRVAERKLKEAQRRTAVGLCPCCNRTFSQLARHMQNKHPDVPFVPSVKPKTKRTA